MACSRAELTFHLYSIMFILTLLILNGVCTSSSSSSSGIKALGGPKALPKLSPPELGPASYASSSFRPHSLVLPQLSHVTSVLVFVHVVCRLVKEE